MRHLQRFAICAVLGGIALSPCLAGPVGSSVTYQGELSQQGAAFTGSADFQFRLFDAASSGAQVGAMLTSSAVDVEQGRFAVDLDFGAAAFDGQARWLEINIRPAGGGAYTTLTPRQRIAPAPYALNATTLSGQSSAYFQDASNLVSGQIASPRLSGTYAGTLNLTNLNNTYAGNGAALIGLVASNISAGTLADARLSGNIPRLDAANTFTNTLTVTGAALPLRLRGGDFGNSLLEFNATGVGAGWYGRIQARNDHATLAGPDTLLLNPDGGFVGIGSSSARGPLEVAGETYLSGAAPHALRFLNGSAATLTIGVAGGGGQYSSSAAGNDAVIRNEAAGGRIHLQNGGAGAAMTIDASNRVGIGTNSPTQKLEVVGTAAYRTARFANPNTTQADAAGIEIFSASSNKAMNLVMGADGIFYIAQASQADGGFGTSLRFNSATGLLSAKQYEIRGGADIAEPFDVVSPDEDTRPGMIVCIDPEHPGKLRLAASEYDPTVAGIISGAGGVAAGLRLKHEGTLADGDRPVALSGRVYCWVDADASGPIRPGDLLTTSATRGHAMRACDPRRMPGSVLGKAMTPLGHGKGLVLVLVSLQ